MDYPRYDPHSALTPLTPAELDALDRLLQGLAGAGAMSLDGLDGYLSALLLAPGASPLAQSGSAWLPLVWGGDGDEGAAATAPFASRRQRKDTVVLVLRHLRHLAHQFETAPDDWEPIFSIAEQGPQEWADAQDWCTGFLQAVDLSPEAWAEIWDDPELGPAMVPLLLLGGGLDGDATGRAGDGPDLNDPEVVDGLSRDVPEAVLRLHARRHGTPAAAR